MRKSVNVGKDGVIFINFLWWLGKILYRILHWR